MKHRFLAISAFFALFFVSIVPLVAQDSDSAFPVTIDHKFGTTTVPEYPERVISLGYTDQDPLFALGIEPIAVRYWFGDAPNGIFPWMEEAANGAEPIVLDFSSGINYEYLLELEPDLIVAIYSGISEDEYALLSEIAPTLPQTDEYMDYGMPWDETTRHISKAFGLREEAENLITSVEDRFEEARQENPQFEGQSIAVVANWGPNYWAYSSQDQRVRFFTNLGFTFPQDLEDITEEKFYLNISEERLDLLDQDFTIFIGLQFFEGGREEAIESLYNDFLLNQLDVMREDRIFLIPDVYDDALGFAHILSISYLLDELVPEIAESMDMEEASE